MQGILLIDKPDGWTSFDVVAYVRKMVARIEGKKSRNIKVGHTGTLDPAATGLLVLCVGREFTKKVPTLIKHDKTYEVELTLGYNSTTGDREGELQLVSEAEPTEAAVMTAVESFIGESMQMPPKFSALKVNGRRAYDLAREGKEVVLQPRKITIHSITDIRYAYPKITFTTSVGSGTYIRSLAEDVGAILETGAYMSALRRTVVGDKSITEAIAVSALTDEILQKTLVD
jgi:tRNA pseudouridine55 synthase